MALGFIGDLLGLNAGDPAKQAASDQQTAWNRLYTDGMGYINEGTTTAQNYLTDAENLYGDMAARGKKGTTMLDNALGLNGAEGNAAATSAFQTNPGYQFQLDQGLQALGRGNSARGSFQSGGAGIDELKYATGYADQAYDKWLGNLTGYNGVAATGTAGQAGALGDLAGLFTGAAGAKTGLHTNVVNGSVNASNLDAEGESANKAGLSNAFGNALGIAGKATGWF